MSGRDPGASPAAGSPLPAAAPRERATGRPGVVLLPTPAGHPTSDPIIAELDAHPERYAVSPSWPGRCPACRAPGRVDADEHGRRRIEYDHTRECWLHPPVGVPPHDETAYLDGDAHPYEPGDYAEDTR